MSVRLDQRRSPADVPPPVQACGHKDEVAKPVPQCTEARDVPQEWLLTVADAATGGEDLALQESYSSFESAAAAVLVQHLVAFDHPVQITSLPPNRWLLKHLDQRDQPVDVIRIHLAR